MLRLRVEEAAKEAGKLHTPQRSEAAGGGRSVEEAEQAQERELALRAGVPGGEPALVGFDGLEGVAVGAGGVVPVLLLRVGQFHPIAAADIAVIGQPEVLAHEREGEGVAVHFPAGLLEFSVSVGRGTDTPFEVLGAPYVNDLRLSHELNKLGLPGVQFTPVRFTPTTSIFKGEACGGVRIAITNREALKPVETGIAIACTLQRLHPKSFALEKVNTLLNHGSSVKQIRGGTSWKKVIEAWSAETAGFEARRKAFLRY